MYLFIYEIALSTRRVNRKIHKIYHTKLTIKKRMNQVGQNGTVPVCPICLWVLKWKKSEWCFMLRRGMGWKH